MKPPFVHSCRPCRHQLCPAVAAFFAAAARFSMNFLHRASAASSTGACMDWADLGSGEGVEAEPCSSAMPEVTAEARPPVCHGNLAEEGLPRTESDLRCVSSPPSPRPGPSLE